jgi:uncharacterized ferritin-like protein (DUF455 family)
VEIYQYCLNVLAARTLSGKLRPVPKDLSDETPGAGLRACQLLNVPGRPSSLSFCSDRQRRHLFPKKKALKQKEGRSRTLHFFANHELLAIEVIARALLLFPEAEQRWRRSLLKTLADEQVHLGLYIKRMSDLGLELGQLPVNDYIWKRALDVKTPLEFVAFFSLALEGANLDHAFEYRMLFESHGDEESAALMGRIFEDEIIHVKRGVDWFDRWRSGDQKFFDSFSQSLVWPMTPARARGPRYHAPGRLAAGFPESFVEQLQSTSRRREGDRGSG